MIDRQLEAEAMDTVEEAREYDLMDHEAVNARFVSDMLAAAGRLGQSDLHRQFVVDVGTGTARIPIELCRMEPLGRIVGVDLAREMLRVGRENVGSSGFSARIALQLARATALPFRDACSPAVVSNSLIHHLPEPARALREMTRVVARGGLLFVRDLFRPASSSAVDQIVDTYAAGATAHQRQLLDDSLRAALTVEEVREAIEGLPLIQVSLSATSDRHWTLVALRASSTFQW
jgi:ubiquinone/menaquinone biosynthesis C-methylase UbiE